MAMMSQFSDMTSLSNFFDVVLFLLSILVVLLLLSKFHVNIFISSGVMTISFYMGLTRNTEIENILVWVLPNIWRLRQVRNIKFGTNVSSKMLLNAPKCQGCIFYHFWVIKGKPTGGSKTTPPPPSPSPFPRRLGLRNNSSWRYKT